MLFDRIMGKMKTVQKNVMVTFPNVCKILELDETPIKQTSKQCIWTVSK